MVGEPDQRANPPILIDTLDFRIKLYKPSNRGNPLVDLYTKGGFSIDALAKKFNCSKATVLEQLKKAGLSDLKKNGQNPTSYRNYQPPFGYSVKDRVLILNKQEVLICRVIVQERNMQKKSFNEITKILIGGGYKNRFGKIAWSITTVQRIYKRWNGKI